MLPFFSSNVNNFPFPGKQKGDAKNISLYVSAV